jgi:hypothetical protein
LVVLGFAAVLLPGSAARAQEPDATPSPSPKELWQAYPLAPEDAPATATPSEAATEGATSPTPARTASSRPPARDDGGGGIPLAVPIGLAALLAFGAGIGLGRVRRSERAEHIEPVADPQPVEPPAPKRFEWRDYPEPSRPAPPPPPPPGPGNGKTTFKAALEAKRTGASSRAKQEEPH